MASKIKKKLTYPTITFSVGRFRFLHFRGKRMSLGYLHDLGVSSLVIERYKTANRIFNTPVGVFGGPISYSDKQHVMDFTIGILDDAGVVYTPDELEIVVRYHVMDDDRITTDDPPAPGSNGVRDYAKNKGYKKLINAEAAAERFFKYYSNWLIGNDKKMIQKVQLILKDEQGKVKLKKTSK
jgi:hypothetical protein